MTTAVRSQDEREQAEQELEQIRSSAVDAIGTLASDLAQLQEIAGLVREGKKAYEKLRDRCTTQLEDGPVRFANEGVTYAAVYRQGERLAVDVDMLINEGVSDELLDRIAPRKVDLEAFRQAVENDELTADLVVRCSRFNPTAAFVQFVPYSA